VIIKPLRISRVNWGNPLASGLVFCAPFNEMAGNALDIVSGTASTVTGLPQWGTEGMTYPLDSMHTFAGVPDSSFLGPFTIIARLQISNTTGYKDIFNKCLAGGATNNLVDFYVNGASIAIARANTNAKSFMSTAGLLTVNKFSTISVVVPGSQIDVAPTIYRDGIMQPTPNGTGGGTGTVIGSSQPVSIGNRSNLSLDMVGTIDYVMVWSRTLSTVEIMSVSANPWQLLAQSNARSILSKLLPSPPGVSRGRSLSGISRGRMI
jgi:Concanavalin A-like lectin/glucanases superfamily